jgi:hypothetical protein
MLACKLSPNWPGIFTTSCASGIRKQRLSNEAVRAVPSNLGESAAMAIRVLAPIKACNSWVKIDP